MKKFAYYAAAAAAFAIPQAAFAQDGEAEVTIGASAGYHDLGVADDVEDITDIEVDDGGVIYGGFIAVDFPVSDNLFAGIEANAHIGTDALDADYGASARFGYRSENGTKVYLRGGYQWVDIDAAGLVNLDEDDFIDEDDLGIDTTVGDILIGAGIDLPLGDAATLRANVDTITFDTFRATAGIGFRF